MSVKKKYRNLLRVSVLLILFLFGRENLLAQIVYQRLNGDPSTETKQLLWEKADSILSSYRFKGIDCWRADILMHDSLFYLLPDGTFDVYLWEKNHWKNLYRGIYYGYNSGSKKFFLDGTLYSFGGFGYWYQNRHLIRFDFSNGEWALVHSTEATSNGIMSLEQHRLNLYGVNCDCFDVRTLKTCHIADCGFPFEVDSTLNVTTLDFSSYTLNLSLNIAIQKATQQVFEFQYTDMPEELKNGMVLELYKDSLTWWNSSVQEGQARVYTRHKTLYVPALIGSGSELMTPASFNSLVDYLIFLGVILLLTMIVWYSKTHTPVEESPVNQNQGEQSFMPVLESLIQGSDKTLSVESLDRLFGIHTLTSQDTQRYKRAQLIREINKHYMSVYGKELIHRIPDPEDGRKYIYLIHSE